MGVLYSGNMSGNINTGDNMSFQNNPLHNNVSSNNKNTQEGKSDNTRDAEQVDLEDINITLTENNNCPDILHLGVVLNGKWMGVQTITKTQDGNEIQNIFNLININQQTFIDYSNNKLLSLFNIDGNCKPQKLDTRLGIAAKTVGNMGRATISGLNTGATAVGNAANKTYNFTKKVMGTGGKSKTMKKRK